MRLYSDTPLKFLQVPLINQVARVYPGRWNNYFLYNIKHIHPLQFQTYSPIDLLCMNRKYYCYDLFGRDKRIEIHGNRQESVAIDTYALLDGETPIYVPRYASPEDIIVIRENESETHSDLSFYTRRSHDLEKQHYNI
jgi:hypothetical protein